MAVEILNLAGASSQEDLTRGTEYISAKEVTPNVAYTYITVSNTQHNDTKPVAITNDPTSVQPEFSSDRYSAVTRLTSAISLPLPRNIPYSFNQDWSQEETGFFSQVINNIGNGAISSISDAAEFGVDALKNSALQKLNVLGFRKYFQKTRGIEVSPFKEIFFSGTAFRTFTFTWEFAPQSAKEAEDLEKLVYNLELASHPDMLNGEASSYVIPDVFNIEFKGTNIPGLKDLALTNLSIEYEALGPKVLENKHMAYTEITMSFLELYPLTKEDIRNSRGGKYKPAEPIKVPEHVTTDEDLAKIPTSA